MRKSVWQARLITALLVGAALLFVVARDRGTGQSPAEFETVGELEPISVRVFGQGKNNGYPSMIRDRQGNFWCVWVSARRKDPLLPYKAGEYGEGDMIVLRKRTGEKWGEPVFLNTNYGVNFRPVLAEDSSGSIFVAWSSRREGRYRLYSRRVSQDLSLGSENEILTAGELEGFPNLVADTNGKLWLVAQSWRKGSQDIVFYTLEGGGWRRLPDVASTANQEYRPQVAVAPDGSVWCVWDVYTSGKYRVMARRFDSNTRKWSEPETVPGDGKLDAYAADVAVDAKSRVWVTYARNEVEEPAYGRRGPIPGGAPRPTTRLVVRDAGTWSYPDPLSGDEPGFVAQGDFPRVEAGPDGGVWVFWNYLPGHVDWKVGAALYSGGRWSPGRIFGESGEPGPTRRADQRMSAVITGPREAVFAYERGTGVFADRDVYQRNVRLSGLPEGGEARLTRFGGNELKPVEREVRPAPKRLSVRGADGSRRKLYMGDLHNHLAVDDGHQGTVDQLFNIHRDRFSMDFGATTSHGDSNKLLISELAHNDALAESMIEDRTFVTIPGFEWTQGDFVVPRAGHRHVIYETIGGPLYRPTEGYSDSIREFVELMSKTNGLLFAHHITRASTAGTDWSYVNVQVEPAVEMCSSWGRFEYYQNPGHINGPEMKSCSVQDAWMMGIRIGVIGGSDGHNLFGDRIQGLTGVYATELSRAGIFDAIRKRHCYATTGDPIELEFRVNDHLMGSEIEASGGPLIEAYVKGVRKLLAVEVIKYTKGVQSPFPTVHKAQVYGMESKVWWRDPNFDADSFYYLRVTQEADPAVAERYAGIDENPFPTEMAWSSPVWVAKQ
jgi:uncharacterized protein DUF3604